MSAANACWYFKQTRVYVNLQLYGRKNMASVGEIFQIELRYFSLNIWTRRLVGNLVLRWVYFL